MARTCSEAFFRTSASAALTTTLRSWLPKPPPPEETVVSPMSLPSLSSSARSVSVTFPESAASFSFSWYEAWLAPLPPPKAAMKPEEPTVTW